MEQYRERGTLSVLLHRKKNVFNLYFYKSCFSFKMMYQSLRENSPALSLSGPLGRGLSERGVSVEQYRERGSLSVLLHRKKNVFYKS